MTVLRKITAFQQVETSSRTQSGSAALYSLYKYICTSMQSVEKDTMLISKVFWLLFVDELTSHMSRVADGDDNWFWRCYFKMNFIHTQIWYLSTLNSTLVSQVSNRTVRLDKCTEEEILAQMIFFRTSASLKTLVVAPSGQIVVRL